MQIHMYNQCILLFLVLSFWTSKPAMLYSEIQADYHNVRLWTGFNQYSQYPTT